MAPRGQRHEGHIDPSGSQTPTQTQDIRRNSDASDNNDEDQVADAAIKSKIPDADLRLMVKNFVRLALACEHTRTLIKREDVPKKVFVNDHKRCLPYVFKHTQERLRATFGMELVELPAKDRSKAMTMTQQRKMAHSQAGPTGSGSRAKPSQSWILRNILPPELKQISQRQHMESDRNYNAIVMVMIIIVVMSDEQCCSESRAASIFERLKWYPNTPAGPFVEVVAKMTKQGYIERVKDDQSTDGAHNLYIGPRGKIETLQNRDELFSVISKIYAYGEDDAEQERLKRIIQDTLENEDEALDIEDGEREASQEMRHEDLQDRRQSKKIRRHDVYQD